MLFNRLGSKYLCERALYQPLKRVMKKKLDSTVRRFFKNYGLVDLEMGEKFPLIKKVEEPWMAPDGLWLKAVLCQSSGVHSITVELNRLNVVNANACGAAAEEETDGDSIHEQSLCLGSLRY